MQVTIQLIGVALFVFCFRADASDPPQPVLRVQERWVSPVSPPIPCDLGTGQVARYFSLAVYPTRQIVYERSDYTFCPKPDPEFHNRWEAPDGRKESFHFLMQPQEFNDLLVFLGRSEVKGIGSFYNAAPISDDFEITIARPAGPQVIGIVAFMPDHIQLVEHPALVHVICKAKELARRTSGSGDAPKYCENLRSLAGDKPRSVPK